MKGGPLAFGLVTLPLLGPPRAGHGRGNETTPPKEGVPSLAPGAVTRSNVVDSEGAAELVTPYSYAHLQCLIDNAPLK